MFVAIKLEWMLSTCSMTCAFFVTFVYWCFLFDYKVGLENSHQIDIFFNLSEHLIQVHVALLFFREDSLKFKIFLLFFRINLVKEVWCVLSLKETIACFWTANSNIRLINSPYGNCSCSSNRALLSLPYRNVTKDI
jgi:hypothetical protein